MKMLEEWMTKHKAGAFILMISLTIILMRLMNFVYNANIRILNFEFHHFDTGLLLLLITSLLVLFGKKKHKSHLILTAVAFGLIIDDFWFIRSNILDPGINEIELYTATIPMVIIFLVVIIAIIMLISGYKDKKSEKKLL